MATSEVQSNLAYHTGLLERLSALDYAPGTFEGHKAYLKDIKAQYENSGQEARLRQLQHRTEKERKEHESIRDSVGRRFTHKIVGKGERFEEKKAKEEKEYVEALEKETKARDNLKTLQALIKDAESAKADLEQKAAQHASLKSELDALYARLFDGPTSEYPHDDTLEYLLSHAQAELNGAQGDHAAEARARDLLLQAEERMRLLLASIDKALSASTYDMFGGGSLADALERSALADAQTHGGAAKLLLTQAHSASPYVDAGCLDGLNIAQGNVMSDILFDNIFSDMKFHEKIEGSKFSAEKCHASLIREIQTSQQRLVHLVSVLSQKHQALANARRELDAYRRSVFESMRGRPSGHGEQPAYGFPQPRFDCAEGGGGEYAPPAGPPSGSSG